MSPHGTSAQLHSCIYESAPCPWCMCTGSIGDVCMLIHIKLLLTPSRPQNSLGLAAACWPRSLNHTTSVPIFPFKSDMCLRLCMCSWQNIMSAHWVACVLAAMLELSFASIVHGCCALMQLTNSITSPTCLLCCTGYGSQLYLPPLTLVAYLRNIVLSRVDQPSHMSALIQGMWDASRGLQHDDLPLTLLRLQLYKKVLRERNMALEKLLPRLVGSALAKAVVQVSLQPQRQAA
jgi:hypothetical protein